MDIEFLSAWFVIGFFFWVVWGVCLGDPGASRKSNIVITIIVAILALPTSIALALVVTLIVLILKLRQWNQK